MRSVTDDPRNVDSYALLGMIYHLRGEDQDALQELQQGLRYARDRSSYASEEYSDLLNYTHQPERAAEVLTDRVARTQHYVDYYKLGRLYQSAGQPKQLWETPLKRAKKLLEETIVSRPLDAQAYSYLALVETRLGFFKNALEASTHARQLGPADLNVLYNTARMFALQADTTQALQYLGKAVDLRFRLSSIIDMDFSNLRSEPEFLQTVTR